MTPDEVDFLGLKTGRKYSRIPRDHPITLASSVWSPGWNSGQYVFILRARGAGNTIVKLYRHGK